MIGTGKRTGKTAIAGEAARLADRMGVNPVVVAMGRGGPQEPQVAKAGTIDLAHLVGLVHEGGHAASDYLEDALTTGVTTIGARRAGGGLAGAPYVTNAREAADLAVANGAGLVIIEGSGAAIPPLPWDAGILVVPASVCSPNLGTTGPFRLLLSDAVVFTMAGSPNVGPENLSALRLHLQRLRPDARGDRLRSGSAGRCAGKAAYLTTTAPDEVAERQASHLEAAYGCRVVVGGALGWRIRSRPGGGPDGAEGYDVLLTELKAAAVDVACERAIARGAEVVFIDNRATAVDGDETSLAATLEQVIELAMERGTR